MADRRVGSGVVADRGVADRGVADRGVADRGVADRGVAGRCEGRLVFLEGDESKLKWQLILEIDAWQLEMLVVAAVVGRSGSGVEEAERRRKRGSGSGLT